MKVAIYARVEHVGWGPGPHDADAGVEGVLCETAGWDVSGAYVDVGISGTKERRPELDRLMADAHKRTLRRHRGVEV